MKIVFNLREIRFLSVLNTFPAPGGSPGDLLAHFVLNFLLLHQKVPVKILESSGENGGGSVFGDGTYYNTLKSSGENAVDSESSGENGAGSSLGNI